MKKNSLKIKIALIFGGPSVEHEVSVISALQAYENFDKNKYQIIPIYIAKNRQMYTGPSLLDIKNFSDLPKLIKNSTPITLTKKNDNFSLISTNSPWQRVIDTVDLAFPIVHGANVEDGALQGYLETIGIPFVGSNVYASVVSQDKIYMKQIFSSEHLPIVDYFWFNQFDYEANSAQIIKLITQKLSFPLIVKPATLGSSIGVNKVDTSEQLVMAIENALAYDHRIVIEKCITNLLEVNISVLGDNDHQELSQIEQVSGQDKILSYEDKYLRQQNKKHIDTHTAGMVNTARIIPAPLNQKTKKSIEAIARQAFIILGSSGVARIDFLIDKNKGAVYINEINNIPGSLSFYLWEATDKKYSQLIDELVQQAIKQNLSQNQKIHSFESNLLNNFKNGLKMNNLKNNKI